MFVEEYPGRVAPELCAQIIARFEASPARKPSLTSVSGVPQQSSVRSGTQLLCDTPEWEDVVETLHPILLDTLRLYAEKYFALQKLIPAEQLFCTVPAIERVDPGQSFAWHWDQTSRSPERVIAGLLYLSGVEGGATEFHEQAQAIQPAAGKIALFPPYWTHLHRGVTPTRGRKYVMSFFWVYGLPTAGVLT